MDATLLLYAQNGGDNEYLVLTEEDADAIDPEEHKKPGYSYIGAAEVVGELGQWPVERSFVKEL